MNKDTGYVYVCKHTHTHTVEYYSALKWKKILQRAKTWMDELRALHGVNETITKKEEKVDSLMPPRAATVTEQKRQKAQLISHHCFSKEG